MMAPAPGMMMAPQMTAAPAQKAEWKEPHFHEVKNEIPFCFRINNIPPFCCADQSRTFESYQDKKCAMPACEYDACTRCESEERFCPQCWGPRIWTGCGRLICAHHAKWYFGKAPFQREIVICAEGCDKERKEKQCKICLLTTCCSWLSCPIMTCCKNKLEVGQRYRGPQGEDKYHQRGDPMI